MPIFFILLLLVVILLLPIILILSPIETETETRKRESRIRNFICVSCGSRLGMEAIRLGNERWRAYLDELHQQYPGSMFRLLRDIHAICPNCGCEYRYQDTDCSLIVTPKNSPDHERDRISISTHVRSDASSPR